MKFTHTEVFNFEGVFRGMRNPMESWNKSDSCYVSNEVVYSVCTYDSQKLCKSKNFTVGKSDLKLAKQLLKAGSDHSKFMRQIMVSVDITAPLYWWKEFDTYKVGTTANSTSSMHKLSTTPITKECFELGDYSNLNITPTCSTDNMVNSLIKQLEQLRQQYLETKDVRYWKELIRWLPSSWLQTRTITMSYQNIRAMYLARKNHKLTEWSVDFVNWIFKLPYSELITYKGD